MTGDDALAKGDSDRAIVAYREGLRLQPTEKCALDGRQAADLIERAIAEEHSGQIGPALDDTVAALALEPKLRVPPAVVSGPHLGQLLLRLDAAGFHDQVTSVLEQSLKTAGGSIEAAVIALEPDRSYRLAQQLNEAHFHADAVKVYKEVIRAFPESPLPPGVNADDLRGDDRVPLWDDWHLRDLPVPVVIRRLVPGPLDWVIHPLVDPTLHELADRAAIVGVAVLVLLVVWRWLFVPILRGVRNRWRGCRGLQIQQFDTGNASAPAPSTTGTSSTSAAPALSGAGSPSATQPGGKNGGSPPSPDAPPGLHILVRSYLRQLTTSSQSARIDMVEGDAEPLVVPTDLAAAVPAMRIVGPVVDLLMRIWPAKRLRLGGQLHGPSAQGVGVTVRLTDQWMRVRDETTFWSKDYDPDFSADVPQPEIPGPPPIPPAPRPLPYLCLVAPIAVWALYKTRRGLDKTRKDAWIQRRRRRIRPFALRPWELLGTTNPRSYALFAAGAAAQEAGHVPRAMALYNAARAVDPENVGAALNHANMILRLLPDLPGDDGGALSKLRRCLMSGPLADGGFSLQVASREVDETLTQVLRQTWSGRVPKAREVSDMQGKLGGISCIQNGRVSDMPSTSVVASKLPAQVNPHWFRALYLLTVHKTPVSNGKPPDALTVRCAISLATDLVVAVERTAKLSRSHRRRGADQLLRFLETMEVPALVLLAAALLEGNRSNRTLPRDRSDLHDLYRVEDWGYEGVLSVAKSLAPLDYRAHYNLACFHARQAAHQKEASEQRASLEQSLQHLIHGLPPTDPDLVRWAAHDPSLEALRRPEWWPEARSFINAAAGVEV